MNQRQQPFQNPFKQPQIKPPVQPTIQKPFQNSSTPPTQNKYIRQQPSTTSQNLLYQNPYAQSKGPLLLFQQEQNNKQTQDEETDEDEQEEDDHEGEEEEEDEQEEEDEDQEEDEEVQEIEEQAEQLEESRTEDEFNQLKNKLVYEDRKYKSVHQIKNIINEVNYIKDPNQVEKINKDLDKLEQQIDNSLLMSRIKFDQDTIVNLSVSSEFQYSSYLKEFDQFQQSKH
ncbi:hypothetical protein pb186bvf_006639 [Paramecium bursaria]